MRMEDRCCVLGCLKTSNDGVRLHEFPFDKKILMPIWIMATKRSNWKPVTKSRICDRHFNTADYEGGDRNNRLKPIAWPMFNNPINDTEDNAVLDSNSSTSDINMSDIDSMDSDDLPGTPDTNDLKFSDDDLSNSNLNEAVELNKNILLSQNEIGEENRAHELDAISLSSSETNDGNTEQCSKKQCAVLVCTEYARMQFDKLYFIDFPKDNLLLCDNWWKLCGRIDKFDPSLKICSIHFDPNDLIRDNIRRNGQLYQQTFLKNSTIVPTKFLLSHEYTIFNKKRKNEMIDIIDVDIEEQDQLNEKCGIPGCKKTFLKDNKTTLFFKFPLKNQSKVKYWLNNMECFNWQPLETDRICSDHFENFDIIMSKNGYNLHRNATPLVNPINKFVVNSKHQQIESNFNNLEFHNLNEDILIVKEKKIIKTEDDENILLYPSKNNTHDEQPKQYQPLPVTVPSSTNSTKKNDQEENDSMQNISNNKNIDLEYVYMDILNNENVIEVQETDDTNNYITNEQTKEISEINEKVLENKSDDITNDGTIDKTSSEINTLQVIKLSQGELTDTNICEDTNIIPKAKNNGNFRDYIYIDMLNGDDVNKFLSFEKTYIPKTDKNNISELLVMNQTQEVPESIIHDRDLTECYGEMLPAYCDSNCQLMCYYSIPSPHRREAYNEFKMLQNVTQQNCTITQLVQLRMVRKGDSGFESYPTYHLIINNKLVKVCRTFFKNTLGIPEHRIDAVLNPINYSWYSDRDTALNTNQPKHIKVISEQIEMTDFIKESLAPLDKDYNLYEPECNTEVTLDNVPYEEYEKVILYIKGIPRVLSSYHIPEEQRKQYFETSICLEYMYKMYSENYLRNRIPPPYTKLQFKKIYNQYMKTFLKMV